MLEDDSLKVQIAEELLQHRGSIQLTLQGNCMWPTVRDADIVTIEKPAYQTLQRGDVVIYKINEGKFHANTIFSNRMLEQREKKGQYVGKITEVLRDARRIDLDRRTPLNRFIDILLSPSNPHFLGLPNLVWHKFRKLFNR